MAVNMMKFFLTFRHVTLIVLCTVDSVETHSPRNQISVIAALIKRLVSERDMKCDYLVTTVVRVGRRFRGCLFLLGVIKIIQTFTQRCNKVWLSGGWANTALHLNLKLHDFIKTVYLEIVLRTHTCGVRVCSVENRPNDLCAPPCKVEYIRSV